MSQKIPYGTTLALHELATRLCAQISAADGEIDETRAILKDAIDRLMPAFVHGSVTAASANGTNGTNATNGTTDSAFSALQFQDISDQQLAHAQQRLRALRVQLLRLQGALDAPALSQGGADAQALANLVDQANDSLTALDLSLAKPVATPHLGTGDMELF